MWLELLGLRKFEHVFAMSSSDSTRGLKELYGEMLTHTQRGAAVGSEVQKHASSGAGASLPEGQEHMHDGSESEGTVAGAKQPTVNTKESTRKRRHGHDHKLIIDAPAGTF